ncbi:hypothetical protein AB0M46_40380 [Dactylosporangium sp. NPDC051485]|uniref:hypothetical protein n=1 Tax=Dactylosporangium sp. NPDC051485 TaxID=3154846 RepID=UPI0034498FD2
MAAGAAGAAALVNETAAQAAPSGGKARIARVVRQTGSSAEVEVEGATRTAPLFGFPDGWRMRQGDRVLLTATAGGALVMPLVEPIQGRLEGGSQSSARIAGRAVVARSAGTIEQGAAAGDSVAFCVRNDADGTLSAVAVRPASSFAVNPE